MINLGLSLLVAFALRLLGALLRPVWVDEAASALFSAGNSSWQTPINRLVPLPQFVAALRLDAHRALPQAMRHLQQEDNHPPLHFALTNLGARLAQAHGDVITPLLARLPAVVLGSLAVPLLHQAVLVISGSRRAARLAAAGIALSPLAVAFGSEARHYALATTWVCGALWTLADGWQRQRSGTPQRRPMVLLWLGFNLLGLLSHHLFVVCIAAQLLSLMLLQCQQRRHLCWPGPTAWVPLLSLILAALWLSRQGGGGAIDQTAWLNLDPSQPLQWLVMPLQMLVSALCAVLAPGTSLSAGWQWPFVVLAGLGTLIGLLCLARLLWSAGRPSALPLVFGLSSLLGLLLVSVLSGKDLSRALRYGFLVLPAVVAWVAVAADQLLQRQQRRLVATLLGCSLLCSLGVATGVALPASYNPALLLAKVDRLSTQPVVLAFQDRPVKQGKPLIGYEALSVAWQLQSQQQPDLRRAGIEPRLLLLLGDGQQRPAGLEQLETLQGPFDLWVINAHGTGSLSIERRDCRHLGYDSAGGHLHHHYRCGP